MPSSKECCAAATLLCVCVCVWRENLQTRKQPVPVMMNNCVGPTAFLRAIAKTFALSSAIRMRTAFLVFAALLATAAATGLRSSSGKSVAAKAYGWTSFSQCDSQWGSDSMGTCGDICQEGCAMT